MDAENLGTEGEDTLQKVQNMESCKRIFLSALIVAVVDIPGLHSFSVLDTTSLLGKVLARRVI